VLEWVTVEAEVDPRYSVGKLSLIELPSETSSGLLQDRLRGEEGRLVLELSLTDRAATKLLMLRRFEKKKV
jgi:hypothetical protein